MNVSRKNRTITLKDQNVALNTAVKLYLELSKLVRICQVGHPEDVKGEPPDVSQSKTEMK